MKSKYFHNPLFNSTLASIVFVILGFAFNIYDLNSFKHIIRILFDFIVFFILIYANFSLVEGIRKKLRKNIK